MTDINVYTSISYLKENGSPLIPVYILAIVLLLCAINCKSVLPNHNPVIATINGPTVLTAGAYATYTCAASDPDGDVLTYTWSCTNGSLSSTAGISVTWTAPGRSGTANIQVTVRDGRGGADIQSKTITVNPITTTIIDWDGAIRAGYYIYWTPYIPSGYRVSGSFSVDAHDINFLILDVANYENWRNNHSYNALVEVYRSAGSSFNATVGTAGYYYIILDNTYSLFTDKFAHLFVQKTSP
jgi:hypothetical protein